MAYQLDLPAIAKIHPMVQVSQLKLHVPSTSKVSEDLIDPSPVVLPNHVVDSRQFRKGMSTLTHLLVQWSGLPACMTTWEEAFHLRRRFPDAPAWGQAGLEEVGIVRGKRLSSKRG